MYINLFQKMKKLKINTNEINSINIENKNKNINLLQKNIENKNLSDFFLKNNNSIKTEDIKIDGIKLSSFEIVQDLIKTFNKKNNEMQFFLAIIVDNENYNLMNKIINSFFSIPLFINIDLLRIELYYSPFLFIFKKIIKELPKVNLEDKKVLWDRVKLFIQTLKESKSLEQISDFNSFVIINELDFDDPIDYIRKEFKEILNAYNIIENIVIIFNNINIILYVKFKQIFSLMQSIFKGIFQFKFISLLNIILIENYIKKTYDNYVTNKLIEYEISIYNKIYIISNIDNNIDKKEKKIYDNFYNKEINIYSNKTDNEDNEIVDFDYWDAYNRK